MKSLLRFAPDGLIRCLHTEAIDLHQLGRLQVVRATDIRFNDQTQEWETCHAVTGEFLFSDRSRNRCLQWEQDHFHPDMAASSIPKLQTSIP